jgi:hypothetical protein
VYGVIQYNSKVLQPDDEVYFGSAGEGRGRNILQAGMKGHTGSGGLARPRTFDTWVRHVACVTIQYRRVLCSMHSGVFGKRPSGETKGLQ